MRKNGYTVVEMIIVMVIISVVGGVAVSYLPLRQSLQSGTSQMEAYVRQVRAKAMSTTSAYRIVKVNNTTLSGQFAARCTDSTWTTDNQLRLVYNANDTDVQVTVPSGNNVVIVCFTSRGLATSNPTITLRDSRNVTRNVEILLGGGIRQL